MNLRPGEIWLPDLGLAAKTRPVIIVSREDSDAPRTLANTFLLTTQNSNNPCQVAIPRPAFLNEISVAILQGIPRFRRFAWNANWNIAGNDNGRDPARSVLRFESALYWRVADHPSCRPS